MLVSSHAYKPSMPSHCTLDKIKRIYPGLCGWAWHSLDLPLQLSIFPIPSLSFSLQLCLLSFSSLKCSAVSCHSIFSVFFFAQSAVVHASPGSLLNFRLILLLFPERSSTLSNLKLPSDNFYQNLSEIYYLRLVCFISISPS